MKNVRVYITAILVTRCLTYPPFAIALSAEGQSNLPYNLLGRYPPKIPGVLL